MEGTKLYVIIPSTDILPVIFRIHTRAQQTKSAEMRNEPDLVYI